MKILILGATGRVGSHIVKYALRDGHLVTVLARMPEKVQLNHERLTVIQGDALNYDAIAYAMHGMEVVISALNTDGRATLSESTPLIIKAMETEGLKRIITIGTAGILQSRIEPDVLRYQSSESKRKVTRAAEEHEKVYKLLKQSNLDWTIVCPTYLPDGERLGNYRTEPDFLPEGGSQISVPDTAEFAYSQIESGKYIKKRVGIAY
ncbi:NAD(P)-dependent oxidoreductase [Edaphobacillus lindanitolerans]|uniref:Putative NADH-flavin reductase n=1 Tax=Edaphobacillus lindanitolerans TaxID=550447 RepID=A0A1U7PP91_9BACI|nr:SDR family oxidoreductase [Edaphobacillus lindanitolerans]SIT87843.1 Putative NADH-flavin reductase [Edaphobacillus lindanitolerans]